MRYSELGQINRETVKRLKPAWTFHTGELEGRKGKTIECTPIVIDGVMYVTTGYLRVVALDAATGKPIWQFDPLKHHPFKHSTGVGRRQSGLCILVRRQARRPASHHSRHVGRTVVFTGCETGKLDPKFGAMGILNLRDGLDPKFAALDYGPTSAPALYNDTIVVGVSCGEGPGIAAPGDIRAFDVHTGKEVWRFRTVPGPGEFGHETWKGDSWKEPWRCQRLGRIQHRRTSRPGFRRARIGGL